MFNQHYVLVGDLFLFEDPPKLAKKVLRFLDLGSIKDHQDMAIHNRANRTVGATRSRKWEGAPRQKFP